MYDEVTSGNYQGYSRGHLVYNNTVTSTNCEFFLIGSAMMGSFSVYQPLKLNDAITAGALDL